MHILAQAFVFLEHFSGMCIMTAYGFYDKGSGRSCHKYYTSLGPAPFPFIVPLSLTERWLESFHNEQQVYELRGRPRFAEVGVQAVLSDLNR